MCFFCFKQKTAYEMRISDWSSDVCSSDLDLEQAGWDVPKSARKAALDVLDPELRTALELAATRIRAYHDKQKPADREETDAAGVRMGARWTPVESAGLYVPGGLASYPSSVLMNAIPAKVAGVERLTMVTPSSEEHTSELQSLMR